jgi:hypothetical protein
MLTRPPGALGLDHDRPNLSWLRLGCPSGRPTATHAAVRLRRWLRITYKVRRRKGGICPRSAPLRTLRARALDRAWARRGVGEGESFVRGPDAGEPEGRCCGCAFRLGASCGGKRCRRPPTPGSAPSLSIFLHLAFPIGPETTLGRIRLSASMTFSISSQFRRLSSSAIRLGGAATETVLRFPDRIRGLVLIDAALGISARVDGSSSHRCR